MSSVRGVEPRAGTRMHAMPFGAELQQDGAVRFRLWAPRHEHIELRLHGQQKDRALQRDADGWHALITRRASRGSRYLDS